MSKSHPIKLTRVSATGNSFILTEDTKIKNRAQFAKKICQDYVGFSTDGFIVLQPSKNADTHWDFFNADGSHAEMCGNASRCVALYLNIHNPRQDSFKIETAAGAVQTKILDKNFVQTEMPEIKNTKKTTIQIDGAKVEGTYINTGVPHFVIQGKPDASFAKLLSNRKEFGPGGAPFLLKIHNRG
jgi:diaminopimelate epimerase